MKQKLVVALLLIIPLLALWPGSNNYVYPADAEYSDLTLSHYPNLLYLKQSLRDWGSIPLWSSAIYSGYPFSANPLSGLGYPATWLLLILPQPFGYNLLFLAHLLVGGIGVYLALVGMGLRGRSAIIGAISFELLPKLISHFAAGHVSLVWAVCLMPWIIYAEEMHTKQPRGIWRYFSGVVLGLIALADVRWAPFAGILFLTLRIGNYFHCVKPILSGQQSARKVPGRTIAELLFQISAVVLISLAVSAVVWLPLVQFSALSTRSLMSDADRLSFSLPLLDFFAFLFPVIRGLWEYNLYVGAFGLVSACVLLFHSRKKDGNSFRVVFWLCVAALSLFWAIGSGNPLMHIVAKIPGFSLLRVPSRSLFVLGLAVSFLSAFGFDILLRRQALSKWSRYAVVFLAMITFGLALALRLSGAQNAGVIIGAAAMPAVGILFLVKNDVKPFRRPEILFGIVYLLILLNLGIVDRLNMNLMDKKLIENEKTSLIDWLSNQPGVFRTYSPSYSIPQLAAARAGLQLADGIDPMQLLAYEYFMREASGVSGEEYAVSIPRMATGNPDVDNKDFVPNTRLLGLLNVKYICAEYPLNREGLRYITTLDGTLVYENEDVMPRAWLQTGTGLEMDDLAVNDDAQITIETYQPNRIALEVTGGPGILVLSEVYYPGWQVKVDGLPGAIVPVGGLLRGVELANGAHYIEFMYRPILVYIGAGISALALLITIICLFLRKPEASGNV